MRFVNRQLTLDSSMPGFLPFWNLRGVFGQSASRHNKDNHDKDNGNWDLGITVDDNSTLEKSKSMMLSAKRTV